MSDAFLTLNRSKCYAVAPGKVLDGNAIIHPEYLNFGPECNDFMDPGLNCISFKPVHDGKGNFEPYLIGIATKDILPGTEVGTTYGSDHWKNMAFFKKLGTHDAEQACMAYYKFRLRDVKEFKATGASKATVHHAKHELSPTDARKASKSSSSSSSSRNSPRKKQAATTNKK